jgi:hypothetical protein
LKAEHDSVSTVDDIGCSDRASTLAGQVHVAVAVKVHVHDHDQVDEHIASRKFPNSQR